MDSTNTPKTEDKEVAIGNYKIKVLRDLCIGAASCVALSPAVFQLDKDSKAITVDGAQDTAETILMAAQSCPTKAIIIIDAKTNQQIWPA